MCKQLKINCSSNLALQILKSNLTSIIILWKTQGKPIFSLLVESSRIYLKIYRPHVLSQGGAFGRQTGPQHHRSSTIHNSGLEALFHMVVCCQKPHDKYK
ncbi:hypothetical protein AMECASPLE_033373 [Ameca splendens]|uniref:Uncharacterized protein n=1 Tax=Ameca splendens TaxID=208324 RepID=A0ABV0YTW9_9TELE